MNGTLLTELSSASAERTGFDRFDIDIGTESRQCIYIKP